MRKRTKRRKRRREGRVDFYSEGATTDQCMVGRTPKAMRNPKRTSLRVLYRSVAKWGDSCSTTAYTNRHTMEPR